MASGEPLASGRAADVFDLGDGTVLRRYRTERDCEPEARLMTWLSDAGIPVPTVHRAAGRDLVMEHIPGATMLEDLAARPWMVVGHIRTLVDLQRSINGIAAPAWLPADERIPSGPAVLHLDLHPMNVIIGPRGPVVIDWTNARRGEADFDVALSYLLMACFEASGVIERVGQRVVASLFRRLHGRRRIDGRLGDAARFRLDDANVTDGERAAVAALVARTRFDAAPPT